MTSFETMNVDWLPGNFRALGVLRLSPAELQTERELRFEAGHDNLDALQYAVLETVDESWFLLLRHESSPDAGTEICVDASYEVRYATLDEALTALDLSRSDLTWVRDP